MRGARPIPDKQSYEFIKDNINGNCLYTPNLIQEYCNIYSKWIQSSKLNNLINLDKFKSKMFVHGTSQSFDFFYLTNHNKRFRVFKGDFKYHQIMWKHKFNWCYLEDDRIQTDDAVIMSLPFSDCGDIHPQTYEILNECEKWEVPVFIDCAYMIMSRDIEFDFNRECIQGVSFSMSKGFYGAEYLRIGIRFTREHIDDPVEVFNSFKMVNWIGLDIGLKIVNNFETDYIQNKYYSKQIEICKELKINPSKCVIFGITDKTHSKFGDYNRGTEWRRVCISSLLGDMKDLQI